MKYGDEAWTEPEPAGSEPAIIDTRILDKAYTEQPPGGWLTVGGTDDEVALNAGRLPGGHAPSVPVPKVLEITVPGGAVDEVAVITLTGTYFAGEYVDVLRDCSAEPEPYGAPYPIRSDMDAASVCVGWAGYLNIGVGFSAKAVGSTIELTPDAGESIAISDLAYAAAAPLAIAIDTAAGDDVTPAVVSITGASAPGDLIEVTISTDGVGSSVASYTAPGIISALLLTGYVAAECNKIDGVSGGNKNLLVNLLANDGNSTVTVDAVLITPLVPAVEGGGECPVPPCVEMDPPPGLNVDSDEPI